MPSSTTTLGGTTAAVYSRCRQQRKLQIRHGQGATGGSSRTLLGHAAGTAKSTLLADAVEKVTAEEL